MRTTKLAVAVLAAVAICGTAGLAATSAIASVSSAQAFSLDGRSVSVAAVSSWPVVIGDEVATSDAPAVFHFQDGSRITLGVKSTLRISGTNEQPMVVLVAGSLDYKLSKKSAISVARAETKGSPATYSVTTAAKTHVSPVVLGGIGAAAGAVPIAILVASSHGAAAAAGSVSSTGTAAAASGTAGPRTPLTAP